MRPSGTQRQPTGVLSRHRFSPAVVVETRVWSIGENWNGGAKRAAGVVKGCRWVGLCGRQRHVLPYPQ